MTRTAWLGIATLLAALLGALAASAGLFWTPPGAAAFNEAFPLYVAMIPTSTAGLALALWGLGKIATPRFLPAFLIGCGVVTGLAWSFLLWLEMTSGAFPPETCCTARTTYAIDLGVIAPGCIAAGLTLWRGARWGPWLALPLLSIAVLLLPMMVLQTVMQLRARVALGPEAAAPFIGFTLVSGGTAWFLRALLREARNPEKSIQTGRGTP